MAETRRKSIGEVTLEDVLKADLPLEEALKFIEALRGAATEDAVKTWRNIVAGGILKPIYPHSIHQLVYYSVYDGWDDAIKGPPPFWFPSE